MYKDKIQCWLLGHLSITIVLSFHNIFPEVFLHQQRKVDVFNDLLNSPIFTYAQILAFL